MGMFGKKIEISQGSKNDVTEVSSKGISKEERAELEKKNKKLIDVFKAFDLNNDGTLDQVELAKAMDEFLSMDKDNKDGKLSKKELKAGADYLNNQYKSKGLNLDRKGLKAFLEAVSTLTQNDEKVSTLDVLINDSVKNSKSSDFPVQTPPESPAQITAPKKSDPPPPVQDPPEIKQPPALNSYTVQEGENYTDIIIRSLKSQGIENPTEEQIKQAKENFNKNNPGALRKTKKGTEYLLVGAKVNLEGKLEDKNNASEQINKYNEKHKTPPKIDPPAEKDPQKPTDPQDPKDPKDPAKPDKEIPKTKPEAAKALGLRETFATKSNGIYYDEKTKTHYKWNDETKQFDAMDKSIGMVGKGGYTFDYKGKSSDDCQLKKDGTIASTDDDGSTIKHTFDDNGYRVKTVRRDSDGKLTQIVNYTYGANGEVNGRKHIGYRSDGKMSFVEDYAFDEKGKETGSLERVYNYDKDGNRIGSSEYTFDGYCMKKAVHKDKDGKVKYSNEYTHDANGNETKSVHKDSDGMVICSYESTYDANCNETKKICKDANGKATCSAEYTYDANGNKTKRVYKDSNGNEISEDEWLRLKL